MKRLIVIGGPMGVGKTTTCRELQRRLPDNAFLDGDWCWDVRPFVVNAETRAMVLDNICHLLNNFLRCGAYENVIFCWVLHEQAILDEIVRRLDLSGVEPRCFSLIASADALRRRIMEDVNRGLRDASAIERGLAYLEKYDRVESEKLDVSEIGPAEAAEAIMRRCGLESPCVRSGVEGIAR